MPAKIRGSMSWLIIAVAMFLGAGPGIACFAWAEDGLEPPVNAVSGLSESPSASAVSDDAPTAAHLAGVVADREPVEEAARAPQAESGDAEEDDPWEPFNARMFAFNLHLDRYVLKPLATAWDTAVPDEVELGLGRMFANVAMPARFVNNLFQLKFDGAGRELARFVLNSTIGLAGFFDVAKREGLEPSNEDTGQTLAVWGADSGPFLVLPFLPPMTVRDGIGFGVDAALNPLTYFAPFAAGAGMKASEAVNNRALNLEVFEDVEEGTLDIYSAVRNGYLQRRARAIQE